MCFICRAYLSQTDSQSKQMQNMDPYDQYEVSVPLNIAGDCLQMVGFPDRFPTPCCCMWNLRRKLWALSEQTDKPWLM